MSDLDKKASKKSPKDPSFDPEAAEKAFEALRPRAQALPRSALALLNVDLQEASIAVQAVARFTAEPEARARFALLDSKLLDPAHLKDLTPLALAAAHAYVELQSARDQSSEAKLPVALVDTATEIKARMLDLTDYHFKRHGKLNREVAAIRAGTGYKDLASDLVRLAKLYDDHKATISSDKVNYQAGDASQARKLAAEIMHQLGEAQSAEEKKWVDLATRLWTLLRGAYAEVQAAGLFLYRNDGGDEKFPSLHSGGGRSRKPKSEPEGDTGGDGEEKPAAG